MTTIESILLTLGIILSFFGWGYYTAPSLLTTEKDLNNTIGLNVISYLMRI